MKSKGGSESDKSGGSAKGHGQRAGGGMKTAAAPRTQAVQQAAPHIVHHVHHAVHHVVVHGNPMQGGGMVPRGTPGPMQPAPPGKNVPSPMQSPRLMAPTPNSSKGRT